jgi:ribosomal protein S18 acetylase RimI-like enzyme
MQVFFQKKLEDIYTLLVSDLILIRYTIKKYYFLMINIKQINPIDTIPIRHAVLRKGKPIKSCIFENDENSTTIHFGIYNNEVLVGVTSYYKVNNEDFGEKIQYQLRGMAVLEEFQGKGLGNILLRESEKILTDEKKFLIWCNARLKAVSFYEKLGFSIVGTSFDITDIGTHFKMFKKIGV